jgi:PUA-domain protein
MPKIIPRKRHILRKSQIQDLYSRLAAEIGPSAELFRDERLEIVETSGDVVIYLVGKQPLLLEYKGTLFPSLKGALERSFPERRVTVDTGAVSYVVNGADVMRPGIVAITDDVREGAPVQIVEERHGKPIALGIALMDAQAMREKTTGKVVKTFHYVGDEIWNIEF